MKHALSIAGVDPSGGAGLIADLKVFMAHNVYAMGAVTALTVQNTQGIYGMELVDPQFVSRQIKAIFDDIRVDAIKIGVVPSSDIIKAVCKTLKEDIKDCPPIVLDPVMACKNGNIWLEESAQKDIVKYLVSISTIITPNIHEAKKMLDRDIKTIDDIKQACKDLIKFGTKNVYIKAGDFDGKSLDVFYDGKDFLLLEAKRIQTNSTHGSGCSLSSAIASNLANGMDIKTSITKANEYVYGAIKTAFEVGHGCNPINHFFKVD